MVSTATKLEIIRAYKAAGYILFPLAGKIPEVKGWRQTTADQYGVEELASGNYGVVLSECDLVIDVDPRNFNPANDNPVKRLIEKIGNPPRTFTVITGKGGVHAYYRIPIGSSIVSKLADYPGLDFKHSGGYVVGPGSIHPDTGKEYTVRGGEPGGVAEAPTTLLELLKKRLSSWEGMNGSGGYKDDEMTQARYIEYLNNAALCGSFAVACRGRDFGLSPKNTYTLMFEHWNNRRRTPKTAEELQEKVAHAYKYASGPIGSAHPEAQFTSVSTVRKEKPIVWDMNRAGKPRLTFKNLLNYLKLPDGRLTKIFGYNQFTCRVEFTNPAPWHENQMPKSLGISDNDLRILRSYLVTEYNFEKSISDINDAITAIAQENKFHPVREYLSSLTWDGKERLDFWLHDYLGVKDDIYTRACARKTLCAAVMRVFSPGCKFDHVLLLEGPQDVGKSTVCRILGGKWSADFPIDPHNKDTIQLMQGQWIVELAEMEITKRADNDALKAFITRTEDRARLAYDMKVGEFPRQSIFIGSKNPGPDGAYLQDDTGNRRWWPIVCRPQGGQIDFKGLKAVRNQLFAEAVVRMKEGEKLYMETQELKELAKSTVKLRHAEHAWTERIASWLQEQDSRPETRRDFLTSRDVFIEAMGGVDKQLMRKDCLSIAIVLRELGWISGMQRDKNGRLVRGYVRIDAARMDAIRQGRAVELITILGDLA